MAIITQDFEFGPLQLRIIGDYRRSSLMGPRGQQTVDEVRATLNLVQEYWVRFLELDFATIGALQSRGSRYVYRVVFDDSKNSNAEANNAVMTIGLGLLRSSRNASNQETRDRDFALFRGLVIHELFHGFTFSSAPAFLSMKSFVEGTADLASYIMLGDANRKLHGLPSYEVYENNPDLPMFDRASPGSPTSSRSTPTTWWLYFVTRVVPPNSDPVESIEALRIMFEQEWGEARRFEPRRILERGSGDFLGNGQDHMAYISDGDTGALAFVSPSASYGGRGQAHSVTRHRSRFGVSGWRAAPSDRIAGAGDLLGNGRDQLVVQSQRPMYLGVLGFDESDGHWRRITERTYEAAPEGSRWGGWKLREGDLVQSIGRIARADREHMIVTSTKGSESAHIGVLGLVPHGDGFTRESLAIVRAGARLGSRGWVFEEGDRIVAIGNLLGGGDKDQLVITRSNGSAIGIVRLNDDDKFSTLSIVEAGSRFGSGWKVNVGDEICAIGRLEPAPGNLAEQLVIKSRSGNIGVVGLTPTGETVTHSVFGPRNRIGAEASTQDLRDKAWELSRADRVGGIGRFFPGDQESIFIASETDAAVLRYEDSGKLIAADNTQTEKNADTVTNIEAIGRFTIGDRDAVYGTKPVGSWYNVSFLSSPPKLDIGLWRMTGAEIFKTSPVFSSTLFQLEQVLRRAGVAERLDTFWRDFTVANVGKDLLGAPPEFSYPVELPESTTNPGSPVRVARQASFGGGQLNLTAQRWSANYVDVPARTQRLIGHVEGRNFPIFWSVVVSKADGTFLRTVLAEGSSCDLSVMLRSNEVGVFIVTTLFSDVEISVRVSN